MKNIDKIVKIKDIKEFLELFDYEWNGVYYHCDMEKNGFEDKPKIAETASELLCHIKLTELYTEKEVDGQKQAVRIYIDFDLDYFTLSVDTNRTDRKFPISDETDYSEQWARFLTVNYGDKFINAFSKKIGQRITKVFDEKDKEIEALEKMIEKINKKSQQKIKSYVSLQHKIIELNEALKNEKEK